MNLTIEVIQMKLRMDEQDLKIQVLTAALERIGAMLDEDDKARPVQQTERITYTTEAGTVVVGPEITTERRGPGRPRKEQPTG